MRACVIGVCRSMADNDSVFTPDYIARFDYQSGVDYVVSFNRQEAQNAPDSRVALPPAFTLVTPANRQQVTDGETVIVIVDADRCACACGTELRRRMYLSFGAEKFFVRHAEHRLERRWP